jgi:hypothetical protein
MSRTRRAILFAVLALGLVAQADAAVSLLQRADSPLLTLVDEETLDQPRLAALIARGFHQELQPVSDCSAVDFGLLTSRIQQAVRVIALVSQSNEQLVRDALRQAGGIVQTDLPAESVSATNSSAELLALRDAMGPGAAGLRAIAAIVPR